MKVEARKSTGGSPTNFPRLNSHGQRGLKAMSRSGRCLLALGGGQMKLEGHRGWKIGERWRGEPADVSREELEP